MRSKRWLIPLISALAFLATATLPGLARAQYTAPVGQCVGGVSDSSCYISAPANCVDNPVSEPRSCPAPYAGTGTIKGTRNSCTGATTWDTATFDTSGCTQCTAPLTPTEAIGIQSAVLGLLLDMNTRFVTYAGPGAVDGTTINNPYDPDGAGAAGPLNWRAGRVFRERVWSIDPFVVNGPLPTTRRFNYLTANNLIPNAFPPVSGVPGNSTSFLYSQAMSNAASYASCSPTANDCNLSCAGASGGMFDGFCRDLNIQWKADGCNDNWQYFDTASSAWRGTNGVTTPWAAPGDFTPTVWAWPDVIGWNGATADTTNTFPTFICSSTVRTCSGWQTTATNNMCISGHTETGVSCDPGNVNCIPATYYVCDMGDIELTQFNDCNGATRTQLQSGLPASCGGSATGSTCPATMTFNAGTSQCECPAGQSYDGTACIVPLGGPPAQMTVWSTNVPVYRRGSLISLPNGNQGYVYNNRDPGTGLLLAGATEEYSAIFDTTAGKAVSFYPFVFENKTITAPAPDEYAYSQVSLGMGAYALYASDATPLHIDVGSRCSDSNTTPAMAIYAMDCAGTQFYALSPTVTMPAASTFGYWPSQPGFILGYSGAYILMRNYTLFSGPPTNASVWRTNDPATGGTGGTGCYVVQSYYDGAGNDIVFEETLFPGQTSSDIKRTTVAPFNWNSSCTAYGGVTCVSINFVMTGATLGRFNYQCTP